MIYEKFYVIQNNNTELYCMECGTPITLVKTAVKICPNCNTYLRRPGVSVEKFVFDESEAKHPVKVILDRLIKARRTQGMLTFIELWNIIDTIVE